MLRVRSFSAIVMGLLLTFSVAFAVESPLVMLKSASGQLLQALEKNQSRLKTNGRLVESLVNQYVLPHADVVTMSRSVVGRHDWNNASPALRKKFMNRFQKLVVETYSAAFKSYDDDVIRFQPLRTAVSANARPHVHSQVIRKSGERIDVSYRLRYKKNQWLVYDFSVEGVSMIRSYRSQFAPILKKSGLSGLTRKIS